MKSSTFLSIFCLETYKTHFSNEAVAVSPCTTLCVSPLPLSASLQHQARWFVFQDCLHSQRRAAAAQKCGAELFIQAGET